MTTFGISPGRHCAYPTTESHLARDLRQTRHDTYVQQTHVPTRRRLRFARLAGFPVVWFTRRCQCCGQIWPCRELIAVVRRKYGWTRNLDTLLKLIRP